MKLRFKYLGFLALFLTGSFLILTWKAYDIFSKKYATAYQNMQIQDLEKQASLLSTQMENLRSVLKTTTSVEPLLRFNGIALMARIMKEDGKWKAQWFEGKEGLRLEAKTIAQQIPFDSLSASKNSWHFVNIKNQGKHLAYVVPVQEQGRIHYYSFFFPPNHLARIFSSSPHAENLTLISPQIGEVYSLSDKAVEGLEQHKQILGQKATGLWPLNKKTALVSYFHPDLQLLFVKNIHLQNLVVESAAYLWALFAMMILFVVVAMLAMDLLFRSLFERMGKVVQQLRKNQSSTSLQQNTYQDEMDEIEQRLGYLLQNPKMAMADGLTFEETPVDSKKTTVENKTPVTPSVDIAALRAKSIQCLGYLHRLKENKGEGSQLSLLEAELRDLRRMLEPMDRAADRATTTTLKSSPFHSASESLRTQENLMSDEKTADIDIDSLLQSIRKPKRGSNEAQDI